MQLSKEHTGIQTKLERYYKFHSHIYDATRWSFLFGRDELMNQLPDLPPEPNILEIGCGTGKNISSLQHLFPEAHIFGVDLSKAMLEKVKQKLGHTNRLTLINEAYADTEIELPQLDLILLSYSLAMCGDASKKVLDQIDSDLKTDGYLAVVDFHTSPFGWFRKWMGLNHVSLEGQLHPQLQKNYRPVYNEIKPAYMGLWSYFLFVGQQG